MISWCRNQLSWLLGSHPSRDVDEKTRAMRIAWEIAAGQMNLRHTVSTNLLDDRIEGSIDGLHIVVSYVFSFDTQNCRTVVRVFSGDTFFRSPNLSREQLVDLFGRSPGNGDPDATDALSDEERAWFLGHRKGIGAWVVDGDLQFQQMYEMDNAGEIVFICNALVKAVRNLTKPRTA